MEHICRVLNDGKIPMEAETQARQMWIMSLARVAGWPYFSLMGTMMYFLLKMSTLDDHFLTLGYASANLRARLANVSPSEGSETHSFLLLSFL